MKSKLAKTVGCALFVLMSPAMIVGFLWRFMSTGFARGKEVYDMFSEKLIESMD